jgi:hypothetical protein
MQRYGKPSDVLAMAPRLQQALDPRILHNLGMKLLQEGHLLLRLNNNFDVDESDETCRERDYRLLIRKGILG